DVEARDDDHVLDPVDDTDKTVLVDDRHVSGSEPAVGIHHFRSGFRALPVTFHHLRPLDAKLATLTQRQLVALFVHHLQGSAGRGQTYRAQLRQAVPRARTHHRRALGQTVAFAD